MYSGQELHFLNALYDSDTPVTLKRSRSLNLVKLVDLKQCYNKKTKSSDDSHLNAKLQKSCQLCLLNTHQSHKPYCVDLFNVN